MCSMSGEAGLGPGNDTPVDKVRQSSSDYPQSSSRQSPQVHRARLETIRLESASLERYQLDVWANDELVDPWLLDIWHSRSTESRELRIASKIEAFESVWPRESDSRPSPESSHSDDPSEGDAPSIHQLGDGGVERPYPNLPPDSVDPPNFGHEQSGEASTSVPRWPSCPRCGSSVRI